MADAVFTLKVTEFRELRTGSGECAYEISPPAGIKPHVKVDHGHGYPTFKVNPSVSLHVGHYQKPYTYKTDPRTPTTVRLEGPHAVLHFRIVGPDSEDGRFLPVGVAFFRADGTPPIATPWTTGPKKVANFAGTRKVESPFSKLRLNEPLGTIEVDVERIQKLRSIQEGSANVSHWTYRCIVFIQESGTNRIGMIDPEVEPPV